MAKEKEAEEARKAAEARQRSEENEYGDEREEDEDEYQRPPQKRMRGDPPADHVSHAAPAESATKEAEAWFTEMLREKKVSSFSTWELELPKFADDPRYSAISSVKEKKALFEEYCKNRVQEEKAEKLRQLENARERFQQLIADGLKAHTISIKTSFDEFQRKFKNDPRLKLVDPKEREALFKDSVSGVKDKEVESRSFHPAFFFPPFPPSSPLTYIYLFREKG